MKLLKGITEVETKTLDLILAAGAEETVTFTVEATEEEPFVAGKTATYYVQAPKAQAEVVVTFEEEPVAPVVAGNAVDGYHRKGSQDKRQEDGCQYDEQISLFLLFTRHSTNI